MNSYSPAFQDKSVVVLVEVTNHRCSFIAIVAGHFAARGDFNAAYYQQMAGYHPNGYGGPDGLLRLESTEIPGSVLYFWQCAGTCD